MNGLLCLHSQVEKQQTCVSRLKLYTNSMVVVVCSQVIDHFTYNWQHTSTCLYVVQYAIFMSLLTWYINIRVIETPLWKQVKRLDIKVWFVLWSTSAAKLWYVVYHFQDNFVELVTNVFCVLCINLTSKILELLITLMKESYLLWKKYWKNLIMYH